MAKRGYKLQEFVAHSGNVNCLRIGKKTCCRFITGGDDQLVNLWSVGKPEPLTSLSGHTNPIESVAFDSAETLVVAGASSGVIKLWDLEETKVVRTLNGHRSYCTAVEFHPFGEFFASGSMDTNLKIWDIRKKGCIHTYKGHSRGISTIKFTPDGRWIVSGGYDNVVKVWDLTAGKLLHDFKVHGGHIRSLEFHPLEFLLATGSADRTVNFWDLETFEMIGSTRRESAGVRSMKFHSDGRSLFCALDDSLKVYSWEPVICHDSVNMGWSTLGDLCVHDGKLLGGAYYENSVGVWVVDMSVVQPYGGSVVPKENGDSEEKTELRNSALEKSERHRRSTSNARCTSPDIDSIEIKNIYVDTIDESLVRSKKFGSVSSPKAMAPPDSKEIKNLASQKQESGAGLHAKTNGSATNKSFVVPSFVPRDYPDPKDTPSSRRDSLSTARVNAGASLRPSNVRKTSNTKFVMETVSTTPESGSLVKTAPIVDLKKRPTHLRKPSNVKTDTETLWTALQYNPSEEKITIIDAKKETTHAQRPSSSKFDTEKILMDLHSESLSLTNAFDSKKDQLCNSRLVSDNNTRECSDEKDMCVKNGEGKSEKLLPQMQSNSINDAVNNDQGRNPFKLINGVAVVQGRTRSLVQRFEKREVLSSVEVQSPDTTPQSVICAAKTATASDINLPAADREEDTAVNGSHCNQPVVVREEDSALSDNHITEDLMQNHDLLLSTFRSRLTKLQVIRHFWERNDIKGAINAMRKLPDHSVQADVVSVLVERTEVITLDLFSCLLPVLLGLLESKVERHVTISLEMLLKLVAVFGPLVRSTVLAPRGVGVDLHAEQRLASCKECFVHLQHMKKNLATLIRRDGVVARFAQQLNLVLEQA